MKSDIVAIDIFCGCGGLTFGLNSAGIKVMKGVDIDGTAKETYIKNNPGTSFLEADIRKVSKAKLLEGIDRSKNKLLLAGCAPCQPFSTQHREIRTKDDRRARDDRRALIAYFAELINKIVPEYVLVENVGGFMSDENPYRKRLIRILKANNYDFQEKILNAASYGVPQKRRRYVLIASKIGQVSLPTPEYDGEQKPYVTVKSVISKYPCISAGQTDETVPNHQSGVLSKLNLKRIRVVPKNGGSRSAFPKSLRLECHKEYSGHSDVYGRMKWNEPAPTLTCKCTSLTNGRFGHPEQDRAISAREAAALQTFPDNYVFYGHFTNVTKHIGNAVPILLAKKLGQSLVNGQRS